MSSRGWGSGTWIVFLLFLGTLLLLLLLSRSVVSNPATLWTVALLAPLSMEFPKQEYWEWVVISSSRGSS